MAAMYPATAPAGEVVSGAERWVFEELRRILPDDWLVLHSLWLKNHGHKLHAEVDFVILGQPGVLLLEVKGGRIRRDQQGWHFIPRSGASATIRHSGPFDQLRSAFYTLQRHLESCRAPDLFHEVVWGYAVITPDCIPDLPQGDTQIERRLWLDMTGFPERLGEFISGAFDHWRERGRQHRRGLFREAGKPLSAPLRERLFRLLRPDFDCVEGLGVEARQASQALVRLTEEQYRVLDYAAAESRHILLGAAGTGKTLLGLEHARRQTLMGHRVLFLCYNRLLARRLEVWRTRMALPALDIFNYHQLLVKLAQDAGLQETIPEDWNTFNQWVSDNALDILESTGALERYDCLVVDEAQDLMTAGFMDVLDLLLRNGLEKGLWLLCLDPAQAIFRRQFDSDVFNRLKRLGHQLQLTINCRNTRPIAAYVMGLSRSGSLPQSGADGPMPVIEYYRDQREYLSCLKKCVNTILHPLIKAGFPGSQIVLLAARLDLLPEQIRTPGFFLRPVVDCRDLPDPGNDDRIRVGTVQSFKGLEAQAVILTGIQNLDNDLERDLLYVGASRAMSVLCILLPVDVDKQVQERLPQIMDGLRSKSSEISSQIL
ncbi:MAG: NERD domain-containing protein [Candidatus Competibacter sp.]|nr:NERD domain-containing protein [Candidatus Competibacter sp.]